MAKKANSKKMDSKKLVKINLDLPEVKEVEKVEEPVVEVVKEEVVVEPTIFDKYRKHINTSNDGYVRDLTYPKAMEMLRYVEKHTNRKMGLNMSCGACVVDLVKMFGRLENK